MSISKTVHGKSEDMGPISAQLDHVTSTLLDSVFLSIKWDMHLSLVTSQGLTWGSKEMMGVEAF